MPDQYETKHIILIDHEIDVTVKVNIFYQEAPLTRYKLQSLRYHILSLFLFFPLSGVICCLQLFHCLICYSSPPSSVSCLLLPVSLLSCLLHISLYTVLPSQY